MMSSNFGINNVNLSIEEIIDRKIKRVEVCLGSRCEYEDCLISALDTIEKCEANDIKYSIHLPLYVFDWYEYDYLDAFYLSKDDDLRETSFKLLEENLKRTAVMNAEYLVIHFPGINHNDTDFNDFDGFLNKSLKRVNDLAIKYDSKILLEYFGSNIMFNDYNEWIEKIPKYSNLGVLVDTGHLYFASKLVGFNFEEAFEILKKEVFAFHFWTTKGQEYYMNNKFYKRYHHIIPNINQRKADDWAFDVEEIFNQMIEENKPIIIEASNSYKGHEYFLESLDGMLNLYRERCIK
ncbi:TIM barrel protein [Clostridiaceae bacterium HSG29]|nr:TIM barrel protein [Clostridiaceae bacterium HSG29]